MEANQPITFGDDEVATAVESLGSASFTSRYVRTDCQAATPDWTTDGGQPIQDHVRDQMSLFERDVEAFDLSEVHDTAFHRHVGSSRLTVAGHRRFGLLVPTPRDLFHVYGPDRNNTKDWRGFYRYAWTDQGRNSVIYSSSAQIVREGRLACNSYAYNGQSSFALVGAGLFYVPEFGPARISIRPHVEWQTRASFTGTDSAPAATTALIGIYVQSWTRSTGQGFYVDRDHWITAFSQNTQSYTKGVTAGGAANVADGLVTEILAVPQRKYNIFVYVYVETSAAPAHEQNNLRFVTMDVEASVPYIVVEETLL